MMTFPHTAGLRYQLLTVGWLTLIFWEHCSDRYDFRRRGQVSEAAAKGESHVLFNVLAVTRVWSRLHKLRWRGV